MFYAAMKMTNVHIKTAISNNFLGPFQAEIAPLQRHFFAHVGLSIKNSK